MSEGNVDYLLISPENENFYAECWLVDDTDDMSAQCFLQGRKHGDEIFGLVQRSLQESANRYKKPIRHRYTAANKGSLALVTRTEGYTRVGEDKNGNPLFERVYSPENQ